MMKEISMHILDVVTNSIRGEANHIKIKIKENHLKDWMVIMIEDNGIGIDKEMLDDIKNPFVTSRTLRKVGLGIPFFNQTCISCNGQLNILSKKGKGTIVIGTMQLSHIDKPPLGNMVTTLTSLITSYKDINIEYYHQVNQNEFDISTLEIKEALGEDVVLNHPKVYIQLKKIIEENITNLYE
ncbi:histidine kinase/DNA gyrase B/HSP90-like ATPase [Natranaerovirga hydrolytica]|uniref:Histidine kinase/DNA gyrase B/HSP90-like ATPase n=1 Tax=Natranaerovirga hydrolytica TaxID=680378 RepID=A0A4R1MXZ2_9FIRM|nr:ATP-binding protein [Natranaerovirga hydrolytica]TCK98076.1 histidine kinase/DNA gyrase B/HSP90-like ATPase [Natranaerovirga hydrolytica]